MFTRARVRAAAALNDCFHCQRAMRYMPRRCRRVMPFTTARMMRAITRVGGAAKSCCARDVIVLRDAAR